MDAAVINGLGGMRLVSSFAGKVTELSNDNVDSPLAQSFRSDDADRKLSIRPPSRPPIDLTESESGCCKDIARAESNLKLSMLELLRVEFTEKLRLSA
jgi:hypothetical protein